MPLHALAGPVHQPFCEYRCVLRRTPVYRCRRLRLPPHTTEAAEMDAPPSIRVILPRSSAVRLRALALPTPQTLLPLLSSTMKSRRPSPARDAISPDRRIRLSRPD